MTYPFNDIKTGIDLESYFRKINYTGDLAPTLQTLKDIHLLHAISIPFENLNPFLRIPVNLDIVSLQKKLLDDQRGGYCFEHNLLLKEVLTTLGFRVRGLAGRVMWNLPPGTTIARGHMLLQVSIDDKSYIADVGFGGLTLTAPLELRTDIAQKTPHEDFRIIQADEEYILQANVKNEWKAIYRFGLSESLLPDYEVSSWYLSNHPSSHFVNGLIAARPSKEARYALRNNELSIHFSKGITEKQVLKSVPELKRTLVDTFGIRLPEVPNIDQKLESIIL